MLSVGYEYGVGEKLDGKMCMESRCAHGRGEYTKRRVSLTDRKERSNLSGTIVRIGPLSDLDFTQRMVQAHRQISIA